MLYYTIFFLLLVTSFFSVLTNGKGHYVGAFFALLLASVAALRYGSGTDFYTYQAIWNSAHIFNFTLNFSYDYLEPGFLILNSLLKIIYGGDFLFFLVYAFITFAFLYFGLRRLPLNLIFPLFLYFCLFYFAFTINAMRQALAMAIFVYSLSFLIAGHSKKFFLLNILAVSFHLSSIIYILFGVLWMFNITKRSLALSLYFPLVALFLYLTGISYEIFKFITSILGKPSYYLDSWVETISVTQWLSRILLFAVVYFFTLHFHKDKILASLGLFYVVGFSLYILFADVAMLSSRVNMTFRVTEIIIAGILVMKHERLSSKLFIFAVFFIPYSAQFFINVMNPDNEFIMRTMF